MTIDHKLYKENLQKFNKNYSQWWDSEGEFAMLHKINPIRCEYILKTIESFFCIEANTDYSKLRLLDIGCGGGIVSSYFGSLGFNVDGIDPCNKNIQAATHYCRLKKINAKFYKATTEEFLNFNQARFDYDIILCLEVLEHISDIKTFLFFTTQLLKKGGLVIFSTINKTLKSYFLLILLSEHILKIIPKKTHHYKDFVKPYKIIKIIETLDKKIILHKMNGLNFDVLSNKFYISDNLDTNYFISFSRTNN